MRSTLLLTLTITGITLSFSAVSFSADQGSANAMMTPELKKDMADMYQKMAECMRTDKTVGECSHEAMKNCPVVAKTGHCPINEGMGPMMSKRMKHPMKGMDGMSDTKNPKNGAE